MSSFAQQKDFGAHFPRRAPYLSQIGTHMGQWSDPATVDRSRVESPAVGDQSVDKRCA
jgi:hypothetical protein